jgi:hypothetical protein
MRKQIALLVATGILATALFAVPAVCAQEAGKDQEVLKLELPKPRFVGTPKSIKTANLEAPRKGARPDVLVPKGCTNLAFEKEVTGSDEEPIIGDLEQLTDGDKEGTDGSYVEFAPGKQYVQIDLEESHQIFAIVLWHFHSQARVYQDVVIQTAADPDFIMDVKTVYNNDHDNSSGLGVGKDKEYIETYEGRIIPVEGVKARYVRFYSNGNTSNEMNHYTEIEIYGK